jgi:hypothetical protein
MKKKRKRLTTYDYERMVKTTLTFTQLTKTATSRVASPFLNVLTFSYTHSPHRMSATSTRPNKHMKSSEQQSHDDPFSPLTAVSPPRLFTLKSSLSCTLHRANCTCTGGAGRGSRTGTCMKHGKKTRHSYINHSTTPFRIYMVVRFLSFSIITHRGNNSCLSLSL